MTPTNWELKAKTTIPRWSMRSPTSGASPLETGEKPGRRVAVLGGGNVAIDAARTSLRLGCEEVTIIYRRSRSDMPANEEEVEQAEEERVRFSFLTVPVEIVGENGKVTAFALREDRAGTRRSKWPKAARAH